jgi:hypothetical protein
MSTVNEADADEPQQAPYIEFADLPLDSLDGDFEDISNEDERVYQFDNSVLTIDNPVGMRVQDNGGHRIVGGCGKVYDVYPKWNYIAWKTGDEPPQFSE